MISQQTKAVLAPAKARGVKLGGRRGGQGVSWQRGVEACQRRADAFAARVGPIVARLRDEGLSLRQLAAELEAQGIRKSRGGAKWTAAEVRNVLLRAPKVSGNPEPEQPAQLDLEGALNGAWRTEQRRRPARRGR